MIKISDFTPNITRRKNDHNTSTANCKVIINNNDSKPKESKARYPSVNLDDLDSEFKTREVTIEQKDEYCDLYKHLASTFSDILKSNNIKLFANIIDNTGKIIVDANSLVTAISLVLNLDPNLIKLSYEEREEGGCTAKKFNPIKKIYSIKVDGYDFKTQFNKQYNILNDLFNLSFEKTIITIFR